MLTRSLDKFTDRVICGDCIKVMKTIPDNSVDLWLTDPPYNALTNWGMKLGQKSNVLDASKWFLNDNLSVYEYEVFMAQVLFQARRILKNDGCALMFCDYKIYPLLFEVIKKIGFFVRNLLIWRKNSIGLGYNWRYIYELVIFFSQGKKYNFYAGHDKSNIISCSRITYNKLHPTQKPLLLVRHFIEAVTQKNDIVIDPFLGSGTTAIACKRLNRRFIGIELDREYCEIARKRLRLMEGESQRCELSFINRRLHFSLFVNWRNCWRSHWGYGFNKVSEVM